MTPDPETHPSKDILEEIAARGWDLDELARRMIRDDRDTWSLTRLALDFYIEAGPSEPWVTIGEETSDQLAHAFGVSSGLYHRLHEEWRAGGRGQEREA